MTENIEKSDILKPVLSNQQSNNQRYIIYYNLRREMQKILKFEKLEPENDLHFCLKNN